MRTVRVGLVVEVAASAGLVVATVGIGGVDHRCTGAVDQERHRQTASVDYGDVSDQMAGRSAGQTVSCVSLLLLSVVAHCDCVFLFGPAFVLRFLSATCATDTDAYVCLL